MTADAAEGLGDTRRRRWWERKRWRTLIVLLLVFGVAIAVLWSQRRPIATGFVDRELARRGVPARYTVDDIGLSRQRLTNVVIGNPNDPDLVADWIVVRTGVGLGGATLDGIEAGHVRMRARLVDGKLSLGAIDKLLPPPSGKPFALPAIDANLQDVRLRVETPQGVIGARLSGRGRLDDGFAGRLALVSRELAVADCRLIRPRGAFALRVSDARPTIEGPMRVAQGRCGDASLTAFTADLRVTLSAALDRWNGRVRAAAASAEMPRARVGQMLGRLTFAGSSAATAGEVSLTAMQARVPQATAGTLRLDGRYRIAPAGAQFAGRVAGQSVAAAPAIRSQVAALGRTGSGTPVAPLAAALSRAGLAAVADLSLDAGVEAVSQAGGAAVRIRQATVRSASGARLTLGGPLLRFGGAELGGRAELAGGGLPAATIDLRRERGGLAGRAVIEPYAAGGARLALTPVTFRTGGGGATRVETTITLSGPLANGRVDDLRMPIAALWSGRSLRVNTTCTPLAWTRLKVSSLTLQPARLTLCPEGGALVALNGGRLSGGARTGALRLGGQLGSSPVTLAASGARLSLAGVRFALSDVRTTIGAAGRQTRIDAAMLDGAVAGGVASGRFSGAGGQIGNVPLILSAAAGDWRFAGGVLKVDGGLSVADAAADRRFEPLAGEGVTLTLAGNRIDAAATLVHPAKRVRVAGVRITHDLSGGVGEATLDVAGITFGENFQPNELTPVTFGVIADVRGKVEGQGVIRWSPSAVESSGRFATDGIDLAAAFGPVTGIRGQLAFTDLLGLVTAPDQVATVETVNPGIAVENGTIRYQLVGNNRVQVNGASWPFANGQLVLEPTLLDFNANQLRRMTFRVEGADAATFLQQFDFDNLNATGTFDGVLPMTFDESGGRIEGGQLTARGGGNIAYVGTITEKDVGTWGNIAFQALKSLDYRNLDITLNGPLAGEMVTGIRFAGVSQGAGTKSNFLIRRLARLPFVFNITIRAPFRQLMDSVRSYYDPSRLIERNLPALMEDRRRREGGLLPTPPAIQPPDSETRP